MNTLAFFTAAASGTAAGDVVAPVLSSPTDVSAGATTGTGTCSSDEGNGTLYWVLSSSITSPTAAQIKAGNDHTGSAALDSGAQSVPGTGVQTVNFTGLSPSTTYYAHFMQEDSATNQSNVVSGNGFTTDALASWDALTETVYFGAKTKTGFGARLFGYSGPGVVTFNSTYFQWRVGGTDHPTGMAPANSGTGHNTTWTPPSSGVEVVGTCSVTGETKTFTVVIDANCADVSSLWEWSKGQYSALVRGDTCYVHGEISYNAYWPAAVTKDSRVSAKSTAFTGVWNGTGWTGGNSITITCRNDPSEATVDNIRLSGTGGVFGLILTGTTLQPTNSGAIYNDTANQYNYIWVHNNLVDMSQIVSTGGGNAAAVRLNRLSRYISCHDNRIIGDENVEAPGYGFRISGAADLYVARNRANEIAGDLMQISVSEGQTNVNWIIEDQDWWDIGGITDTVGAIHGDILQMDVPGTGGAYIEGEIIFRRITFVNGNNGAKRPNVLIFGQQSLPVKLRSLTLENWFILDPSNCISIGNFTCDELIVRRVTNINDVASTSPSVTTNIPQIAISGMVGNVTVEDCVTRLLSVTSITGNVTLTNNRYNSKTVSGISGTTNDTGGAVVATTTLVGQQAIFNNPYSASGGSANHGDFSTNALMQAELYGRYYGIGSADNIGAYWPDGWKLGSVYADTYALTSSAASISEDGSVTVTATLKRSGVDAMRGADVVITLTEGGTAGNTGTYEITIPAGESSGSVVATEAGSTTGTWTFTGTSPADLTDPSALSITVGASSPPAVEDLGPLTPSFNENIAIGNDLYGPITGNKTDEVVGLVGVLAAYAEAYEKTTDVWWVRATAVIDKETAPALTFSYLGTLAGATGSPHLTGNSETAGTATINNVNEAPVWDATVTISITTGSTDAIPLSSYCADPEGTALTFTAQTSLPTGWSIVSNELIPAANAVSGSFTCRASDGSLTADKTVTLTVLAATGRGGQGACARLAEARAMMRSRGLCR